VVLSDGGFEPLTDLSPGKARLDFVRIGKRCDNVAITALAARRTPSGDQQVFVGLRNFADHVRKFNLELTMSGKLIAVREETLPAGGSKSEMLNDLGSASGRVTAKLDIADDLAADNIGNVYLSKPRMVSVLLISKGNVFLQNALNLDHRTQLTRTESIPSDADFRKYDLIVFDGIAPAKPLTPGAYMLINTSSPDGPAVAGKSVARPTIIDSAKNHPVTSFVDFTNVRIAEAHWLTPQPWATPIVEGADGALGVAGSANGRRFVELSWNILQSDFPLRVGFPIFVANCLDWLVPQNEGAGESVRTGQPAYIDVPPDVTDLTVTCPDGRQQSLKVTQTPFVFDNTEQVGTYQVTGKGVKKEFSCNLTSAEESNTAPKEALVLGEKRFTSNSAGIRTNREFYALAIFIALAALTFEWYAFHRRL
jgi:hypothetical protein